jgi:hypothetical protein
MSHTGRDGKTAPTMSPEERTMDRSSGSGALLIITIYMKYICFPIDKQGWTTFTSTELTQAHGSRIRQLSPAVVEVSRQDRRIETLAAAAWRARVGGRLPCCRGHSCRKPLPH